jgi:GntR family transcriptional regulator
MAGYEDTRDPYERIAADLRSKIMSGVYLPDADLPTTAEFREEYKAAPATVQKALDMLKTEGWIVGGRGARRKVRPTQIRIITAGAYFDPKVTGYSYDILEVGERTPGGDVGEALGGTAAVLRHRIMRDSTGPLEVDWSYYPSEFASNTRLAQPGRINGGAGSVLQELGLPERRFEDVVTARGATDYEARHLLMPPGVPVLRILRKAYSENDRLVGVTVLVKAAHLLAQRYIQDS